jgi:spore coat protein U-like protein
LPDGLLDFGRHFSVAADSPDVQATMPLRCNDPLMTPTITFDSGTHPTGSDNGRRNLSGPDGTLIAYRLLRGPARDAPPWDDQGYSVPLAADGTGLFSVFGCIPIISEGTADGHYTDMVVVRLDY